MKALLIIVALAILIGIMLLPYHPVSACPTPTYTATPTATATELPKLGPVQLYLPWVNSPALVVQVWPTATPTPGEGDCSRPHDQDCKDD